MYGKHFKSMYTGSMFGAGAGVFAVWGYIISTRDPDGFIEINPDELGPKLGMKPSEVEHALEYLTKPDPKSRSKREGGRRLVEEGHNFYRIVNHDIYLALRKSEDRREYLRQKKRESRARKKGSDVNC
jgi:hypothetical protein